MTQERKIDIDVLLRDTFLTVVELRQGTSARHGQELYRHCLQQVEGVRERLTAAGFSQQDIEHITYAQCALLDETVLSRDGMDDGQMVWLKNPLQSHFFNTLQAGELAYEAVFTGASPHAGGPDMFSSRAVAGVSRALSGPRI